MNAKLFGLAKAVHEGWAMFAKHPLLAVSASVFWIGVFGMIIALWVGLAPTCYLEGSSSRPVVLWSIVAGLASLCLAFALAGGAHTLLLDIASDNKPRLGHLADGLRHIGRWSRIGLGMTGWLFACFALVVLVVGGLVGDLGIREYEAKSAGVSIGVGAYLRFAIACLVALSFGQAFFAKRSFTYFLAADGEDVRTCDQLSAQMSKRGGIEVTFVIVVLAMLVPALLAVGYLARITNANAFGVPGWIAFWAGVLFVLTLSLCSVTSLYVRLRDAQADQSLERSAA
jgi:hypothetical protein